MNWLLRMWAFLDRRLRPRVKRGRALCVCNKLITVKMDGSFYKHKCLVDSITIQIPTTQESEKSNERITATGTTV